MYYKNNSLATFGNNCKHKLKMLNAKFPVGYFRDVDTIFAFCYFLAVLSTIQSGEPQKDSEIYLHLECFNKICQEHYEASSSIVAQYLCSSSYHHNVQQHT